jgi:hypothetical protein
LNKTRARLGRSLTSIGIENGSSGDTTTVEQATEVLQKKEIRDYCQASKQHKRKTHWTNHKARKEFIDIIDRLSGPEKLKGENKEK